MKTENKLKIIFTVDVEGPRGSDPIRTQIWGRTNSGQEYGIPKIMDILDEYHVKGLFFVDFAEANDLGKADIIDVARYIDKRGHDVGVHLHPHHILDPKRHFMWQYTKKEQNEMITYCTALYSEALNKQPLSFRAGKYSANYETLNILSELGYRYDFSEFYKQKWCGINPPLNRVKPTIYKNIIELPVTVFNSFSFLGLYSRFDKLDFNITPNELKEVLLKYKKKNCDLVISLFAHSFSLLDFVDRPDNPLPIIKNEKRLINILDFICSDDDMAFLSEMDLQTLKYSECVDTEEDIVKINFCCSIWYLYLRTFNIRKHNIKARLLLICYYGVFIALILLLLRGLYK